MAWPEYEIIRVIDLPATILANFRPATTHEVHSWSFGRLTAPRRPAADSWQQQRGTLDDQAIFGPLRDFVCVCGKYRGQRNQAMICEICGVKLTTEDQRRWRFGHIDLAFAIPHPFDSGNSLSAMPVLPGAYTHSRTGEKLAVLYDRLVTLAAPDVLRHVLVCLEDLFELLLPVLVFADEWNLEESATLARGLALERRGLRLDDYACECGYPLAGLDPAVCPGCGRRLRGE